MSKNLINLNLPIANAVNRAVNAKLAKIAEDSRRAAGYAAFKGKDAMRDKILDSPTGSKYHEWINIMRGNNIGARYDTGAMFNSVSMTRGKIIENQDKRKRSSVTASFGWPIDASGDIAPVNPSKRSRESTNRIGSWAEDPRYFKMQEYGWSLYNVDYPGMFAQKAGLTAARKAMDEYFRSKGYKR